MSGASLSRSRQLTSGDAAVDGLLAGVLGGAGMAIVLVAAGLSIGDALGEVLARFAPGGSQSPLGGLLIHLAVSAIYGALFGLVYRLIHQRGALLASLGAALLVGALYGLALLLLAQAVFLPGAAAALQAFNSTHFLLAHLAFGGILGLLIHYNFQRPR